MLSKYWERAERKGRSIDQYLRKAKEIDYG
jgi:hypothetical protein